MSTMASLKDHSEPLKALLLPHYEAIQTSEETSDDLNQLVGVIQKEINQFALSVGVQGLTLDKTSSATDSNQECFEEDLAKALMFFSNCVFATEGCPGNADAMEIILDLTAALATSLLSVDNVELFVARAIEFTTVLLERIRALGCNFIGILVKHMMLHPARNEKFLDQASQALLPRFTDKSQAVRKAAIEAGIHFFFKDSTDPDILEALIYSAQHEPSVVNRIAAIQSLPVNLETIDVLLSRVRDVKSKVRVAALQILEEKNAFGMLDSGHLAALVETGMTDRCEATKTATIRMIRLGWMKAVGYDPIKLLRKMNVLEYEAQSDSLLRAVINTNPQDLETLSTPEIEAYRNGLKDSLIVISSNDQEYPIESLFFARVVCGQSESTLSMLGSSRSVTAMVLPDVTVVCDILEGKVNQLIKAIEDDDHDAEELLSASCQQLLSLAVTAELEEGSRRHVLIVMKRMLSSIVTPDDLVEDAIKVLKGASDCETLFLDNLVEIIDEISRLSNIVDEELKENHLLRTLSILNVVLEKASSTLTSHPRLNDIFDQVLPAVRSSSDTVREVAVSCLGKLGFFSDRETTSSTYKALLLELLFSPEEKLEIQAQALLALSDWAMLFSDTLVPMTINDEMVSFQGVVNKWLDSEEPFAISVAVEVASKLLINDIVCDKTWLARLVIVYFDSRFASAATESDDDEVDARTIGSPLRLQQLLSVFFPAFCLKSELARDNLLESVEPMIFMLCEKLNSKKKSRGLKAFPVEKMISFVCDSVRQGDDIAEQAEEAQSSTAASGSRETEVDEVPKASIELTVAIQVARCLDKHHAAMGTTFLRTLFKVLASFDLSPGIHEEPPSEIVVLQDLVEALGLAIDDNSCIRALEDMNNVLASVRADCESEDDSSQQDHVADNDEQGNLDSNLANALVGMDLDKDGTSSVDKENVDQRLVSPKTIDRKSDASSVRLAGVGTRVSN